jgi:hypothetical protein
MYAFRELATVSYTISPCAGIVGTPEMDPTLSPEVVVLGVNDCFSPRVYVVGVSDSTTSDPTLNV